MNFLTQQEKVVLIIMVSLTLISLTTSIYLALNQTCTNIKSCVNKKLYVMNTGVDVDKKFKEKYEGLKNKIGDFDAMNYNHSGNLTAVEWNQIAQDLAKMYDKYDAFVLLASHDNIPYTASALSFMMENLGKPIVFADGDLLTDALVLASQTRVPEVMIASKEKLLRGCRTIVDSEKGYGSPNYPPLDKKTGLPAPKEAFQLKMLDPRKKIAVIKLYPGMNADDIAPYLSMKNLQGIVLELLGNGAPTSPEFLKVINELANKGIVILAVGNNEETDMRLLEAGALPGYDMTTEAAFGKLSFLLANVDDKKLIGKLMDISFRGEMTTTM